MVQLQKQFVNKLSFHIDQNNHLFSFLFKVFTLNLEVIWEILLVLGLQRNENGRTAGEKIFYVKTWLLTIIYLNQCCLFDFTE